MLSLGKPQHGLLHTLSPSPERPITLCCRTARKGDDQSEPLPPLKRRIRPRELPGKAHCAGQLCPNFSNPALADVPKATIPLRTF